MIRLRAFVMTDVRKYVWVDLSLSCSFFSKKIKKKKKIEP